MKIEMTKPRQCGCGRWGCLEAYASATAVVKRAQEALAADGGQSSLHARCRRRQDELTAHDVFDAAAAGDALADKIVEETAVLPGGRRDEHDAHHRPGHGRLRRRHDRGGRRLSRADSPVTSSRLAFPVPAAKTQIRYAELGSDAGFIGAAACGRLLYKQKNP